MYKFLRFPAFKDKAMTLSYDDGVVFDKRLVEIMQKYGLKGTFNLNGGAKTGEGRRMGEKDLVELFRDSDMEVGMHGLHHLMVTACTKADILGEFYQDKLRLESVFGTIMRGGAYAYGAHNEESVSVLRSLGVEYFRTTKSTGSFALPTDWLRLNPTAHHNANLTELFRSFVEERIDNRPYRMGPRLFYLWGHSYEFEDNDNWNIMEDFGKMVAEHDDIWHVTNGDLRDYVKAYDELVFSADGKTIRNRSAIDVYLVVGDKNVLAKAGETTTV